MDHSDEVTWTNRSSPTSMYHLCGLRNITYLSRTQFSHPWCGNNYFLGMLWVLSEIVFVKVNVKLNFWRINTEPNTNVVTIMCRRALHSVALHPVTLLSTSLEECDICHFQTCFPFTHTIERFVLVYLFLNFYLLFYFSVS